ncbi:hypothetical protein [Kitasatospora sp. MY 5-36]|uniref:hypothetical protein n=1 Tax=Kitasatospora sp. MY 5-36 TaxID=1678027 RepID=UPI00131AA8CD|nr:hypothetical protein [Kitasatospora sp. MY 5-36]
MTLKISEGTVQVELTTGARAEVPLVGDRFDGSSILSISYMESTGSVEIVTLRGDNLTLPLAKLNEDVRPAVPVVYLDQCHWSTVANRIYNPNLVRESDVAAVDLLIAMARRGELILPFSSGHAIETAATYNVKRQDLAAAILDLSQGWQMRSPIRVRKFEMAQALALKFGGSPDLREQHVFSSLQDAIYTDRPVNRSSGLPEDVSHVHAQLTLISALYDVLLDPEKIDSQKPVGWAEHHNRVSRDGAYKAMSRSQKREAAIAIGVSDVIADISEVAMHLGLSSGQAESAVAEICENLVSMPFLGLYIDAVDERLANGSRWVPNDLVDMLYLGCAAAYADIVVAERVATAYLNSAWKRRPGSCPVVSTISEAVERLQVIGVPRQ